MNWKTQATTVIVVISAVIGGGLNRRALGQTAQRPDALPRFEGDSAWPPKLPNNWVLGPVSSIAIDGRDHIWLLHRPRLVAVDKKDRAAPPVLEFDAAGQFVQ